MNRLFNKTFSKTLFKNCTNHTLKQQLFYNNQVNAKFYHPIREVMKKDIRAMYSDPNEIGEELIRIISLHDKVKDPSKITINSSFEEIGLDSLDYVECILEIENYLFYDFGATDWEQFITIKDIAMFLAKDFFAQKH